MSCVARKPFFFFFFWGGGIGFLPGTTQNSKDGVLVLVLTQVLFFSTWLFSVLGKIHEYMYSYLLEY